MVGKQIPRYKVFEEIGRGGIGVVYKAEGNKLNRDVAIKFLPHKTRLREKTDFKSSSPFPTPSSATVKAKANLVRGHSKTRTRQHD